MNKPKIYVASLKDYNEGILTGQWVTLPIDEIELQEIYDKLSYGGKNDVAIHDYENLFMEISECENIFKLNKFYETLSEVIDIEEIKENISSYSEWSLLSYIKDIAYQFDLYDYVSDFISYEEMEDYCKSILEDHGIYSLQIAIGDVNLNKDIFKINGYGHIENVYINDLKDLLEEIIQEAYGNF